MNNLLHLLVQILIVIHPLIMGITVETMIQKGTGVMEWRIICISKVDSEGWENGLKAEALAVRVVVPNLFLGPQLN